MGCFLSCFRTGSDRSGDLHDPLVAESRLGDAFLDDGKKNEANGRLEEDAGDAVGIDEELRREANYLKSCGTISQTPPEILEVSSPVSSGDTNEHDDISNKAPGMSGEKLFEGNSPELSGPEKCDILRHQENPSEDTNESNDASINAQTMSEAMPSEGNSSELFKSDEHDIARNEENVVDSSDIQTDEQGILDAGYETLSSLRDKPSCHKIRNQITDSSDSPFPTPLVLRGDIQTPGTVYTTLTSKAGKRARGRQFIYPVLRPIENKLQWMEVKLDSPMLSANPSKRRYLSPDSSENPQEISPSSVATKNEVPKSVSSPIHDSFVSQNEVISPEESKGQNGNEQLVEGGELSKQNSEYGKHGVSSLSYWLKTSSTDNKNQSDTEASVGKESIFDVPIFATSSLNWDNDNPTPVLPKAWDGNGIPNTTTKYKEDQVVSWHATPFEERLLKVLSSEKPSLERKISGKLIHLEEDAE
ncbi:hypothetical protein EJB05_24492 [Eragrostis curvula]|uniref:Protein JASON n=1 Tax=Eragrostis curvula TaxID=38414 RepID=A0A5J9V9V2_9POAL|nr:hypothetical protein EJB05_24492 [Eragrostis curvula]